MREEEKKRKERKKEKKNLNTLILNSRTHQNRGSSSLNRDSSNCLFYFFDRHFSVIFEVDFCLFLFLFLFLFERREKRKKEKGKERKGKREEKRKERKEREREREKTSKFIIKIQKRFQKFNSSFFH